MTPAAALARFAYRLAYPALLILAYCCALPIFLWYWLPVGRRSRP